MPRKNKIPFFVDTDVSGNATRASLHVTPNVFPSFVLVFNNQWNDYGVMSEFALFYYAETGTPRYIGDIKIMTFDQEPIDETIPKRFKILGEKYCSIGQTQNFYFNLKDAIDKKLESVLWALRNAAFFPEIRQRFEKKKQFKGSLIRYNDVERTTRTIKHEIYGHDLTKLYQFKYDFKPAYAENTEEIEFNFENTGELPTRVYAVIGKNGTGKTQLISSLPLNIARKKTQLIKPKIPLFSKIISVSYSAFDKFEIPKKTENFNYVYCGLRKNDKRLFTEIESQRRFNLACDEVEKFELVKQWREILSNFLQEELLNQMVLAVDEETVSVGKPTFKIDRKIHEGKLSSGQKIMLYIITEIVANIYFDSLILFDEPETHLHPNAISQLINTIQSLVEEFQSYCIITTHSPIIVREILSKNVYVIERHLDYFELNKIDLESFGENLGTLTEKVFGTQEVPKHYKKVVRRLYERGKTFDEIVQLLEVDQVPLSLNLMLFIKSQENAKS